jgi:predicted phosphohydrolase
MNAILIEKEQITDLHYPSQVSEKSKDSMSELLSKCKTALSLGNLHKVKCTIFFNDSEGLKKVNTTIWGLMDEYIVLKGGVNLNLRYVEDIVF